MKYGFKRAIIFFLIIGVISVLVITFTNIAGDRLFRQESVKMIIDTDAWFSDGDLFTLSRALKSKEIILEGITVVNNELHPKSGVNGLDSSLTILGDFLKALERTDVFLKPGAGRMLGILEPEKPITSEASEFIIQKATETGRKDRLSILCLGPLTNVASAIIQKPEIAGKLKIYFLGSLLDPKARIWNKNELNCRSDLHALDFILNNKELELIILPLNVGSELSFEFEELSDLLSGVIQPWNFIYTKLNLKVDGKKELVLPELALIEAILEPEYAKLESILPPPENDQHSISVLSRINAELMNAEFSSVVLSDKRKSDILQKNDNTP